MTNATAKDKKFWDKIADKYSRDAIADEAAYNHKLEMTREYFAPDSKLFEFGCGTGSTALLHAPYVARIDATDLSSEMIRIAKSKAEKADISNVHFAVGDVNSATLEPASYDMILGLSILHLLRDRTRVYEKIHAALKPGGVFVSSTACLAEMGIWRFLLPVMQLVGKAPYVSVFTQADLVEEQANAGLEVIHQWQPKAGAAVFLVARKS